MKRDAMENLEAQLRREAEQIRGKNGFSPILHQRIMASLQQHGLKAAPVRREPNRWAWRLAGPMAVAAGVALAAWLILRPAPQGTGPGGEVVPGVVKQIDHGMPEMPNVSIAQQVDPTSTALDERKYAYLDRDARKLLTFVADQLPGFPSPPGPK